MPIFLLHLSSILKFFSICYVIIQINRIDNTHFMESIFSFSCQFEQETSFYATPRVMAIPPSYSKLSSSFVWEPYISEMTPQLSRHLSSSRVHLQYYSNCCQTEFLKKLFWYSILPLQIFISLPLPKKQFID